MHSSSSLHQDTARPVMPRHTTVCGHSNSCLIHGTVPQGAPSKAGNFTLLLQTVDHVISGRRNHRLHMLSHADSQANAL